MSVHMYHTVTANFDPTYFGGVSARYLHERKRRFSGSSMTDFILRI